MKKNGRAKVSKNQFIKSMSRLGLQVARVTIKGKRYWECTNAKNFSEHFETFQELYHKYRKMVKK